MATAAGDLTAERPWLSHYDPGVPPEVEIPEISLDDLLRRDAARYPGRTALIFYGAKTTFAQLDRAVDRFAHVLRGMGVTKGVRVSLHLPTTPAFVIAFLGSLRAGAIAVPMSPLLVDRELAILFGDTRPSVTVTLDLLVPRMQKLAAAAGDGRPGRLIVTGIQDSLPVPIKWLYPITAKKGGRWNPVAHSDATPNLFRLLAHAPAEPFTSASVASDIAVLQPTGGTTGTPKTAMLTHRNLVANAVQVAAWFPSATARSQSTILCPLPLFHIYGLTVDLDYALLIGGTLILVPRFDVEQVLKSAASYHPNLFPGAPIMYESIAHHPSVGHYDLSSIEACISGAAPLPPEVQQDFEKVTGGRLCEGYGLTEASPVTHCNPIDGDRRSGTIGLPFPSTLARVVDPDTGAAVALGEVGELEVFGPQVMAGYWNRPDESAAVLHDGWLRTGDMACRDGDGYFTIVDRKKDLIIVGGMNVYPREVEEILMAHEAVADATVVGVPDPHRGEVVHAFVVFEPGMSATVDELLARCRANLARYKVPRAIDVRESLPKTVIGKVLRKELRAELLAAAATAPAGREEFRPEGIDAG